MTFPPNPFLASQTQRAFSSFKSGSKKKKKKIWLNFPISWDFLLLTLSASSSSSFYSYCSTSDFSFSIKMNSKISVPPWFLFKISSSAAFSQYHLGDQSWAFPVSIQSSAFLLFSYFCLCWVFCAVLDLSYSCGKWGLLFIAVHRLLIAVVSLVGEHGL